MASLRHLLCIGLMCYLVLKHCYALFLELGVSFASLQASRPDLVSYSHIQTATSCAAHLRNKVLIYTTLTKANVSTCIWDAMLNIFYRLHLKATNSAHESLALVGLLSRQDQQRR